MKQQIKKTIATLFLGVCLTGSSYAGITFKTHSDLNVSISPEEAEVVMTAWEIFQQDYNKVFDARLNRGENAEILIGTLGLNTPVEHAIDKKACQELRLHKEAFLIQVKKDKLYVLGSDKRGTAYGILELSRLIGVSPWEWWADASPAKKESWTLKNGFSRMDYPSVTHRGIFINDEDWGLTPWSSMNYEPAERKGQIGPKTHARIFELLLRLRANTFWPAMHSCSVAFYQTPGNKEVADKYGIFIGTSHCEPMVRNANFEWKLEGTGRYDYVNNRENVLKFWEERVVQLAGSDNIYTLGIRGVHDGKMEGANTLQEQKDALTKILKDQREMIAKHVNPNVEEVSQAFIPYKEVLDVYHMGLEVPEDVSLIWCDDNYGYIRHFPNEKERARKGGNGIYYHVSYWGRPHDYLWLSTNHPAQLYTQMKMAYDKGARNTWILNVGDIKPGEYLTELFLDMAWNIKAIENNGKGLDKHLHSWLEREFGEAYANQLLPIMNEYYRLAYIRKPEFMAGTRTEEKDPKYNIVTDLPWSETEIRQRIGEYESISTKVKDISTQIPTQRRDAWFQLIEYPVRGATEMNKKHLYGQLARHGKADWQQSDEAFDAIVSLTEQYNAQGNGKWNRMMDYKPRRLTVYNKVERATDATPLPAYQRPLRLFNGIEYTASKGEKPTSYGLGYQRGAISLPKGSAVDYRFEAPNAGTIKIELALAPNHPVDDKLRYSISVDGETAQVVDYATEGRSEEWKENVLRNQARRTTTHNLAKAGKHTVKIVALDEGVVVDQIVINDEK